MANSSSKMSFEHVSTIETLDRELRETLAGSIHRLIPRFFNGMPPDYFFGVTRADQIKHLHALVATELSDISQELLIRSDDGRRYTFINDHSYPGQLGELLRRLPRERPLRSAKVYSSSDGSIVIDIFDFGEQPVFNPGEPLAAVKKRQILDYVAAQTDLCPEPIAQYIDRCSAQYIRTLSSRRICAHYAMVESVCGSDSVYAALEQRDDEVRSRIVLACGNGDSRTMFERIARHLGQVNINIERAYVENVACRDGHTVALIELLVDDGERDKLVADDPRWHALQQDLRQLAHVGGDVLELAYGRRDFDLRRAELLVSFCRLVQQRFCHRGEFSWTYERVLQAVLNAGDLARAVVDLFCKRFDPATPAPAGAVDAEALRAGIAAYPGGTEVRRLLQTLLEAVLAIVKTNAFFPERYALAFSLCPQFLASADAQIPYGTFFIHGADFDGFHVRFRDIARGGVRIVPTQNQENHLYEINRLYDEAYGLAYAQQLKNKDIPEGGAKGVILLRPGADAARCGRAFADAILDLITPHARAAALRKEDHNAGPEFIYLGPDENVTPELICWIVRRAASRGYPLADTFMSSKPGAGINHKRYGVTSEGVTVFLETALRHIGIDPRSQPFSIKLTGGPDGDVAGNEIRILLREFGANPRIVGIADGSGCAEDPDGLDHLELLRLVDRELPIAEFDSALLGRRGKLSGLNSAADIAARNGMHQRIESDAFVPAGGRPRTINEDNWQEFMLPCGQPSSRVIVEGANLFITPAARQALADNGVIIVKDSSANKCGVICSSLEIIAGMLLSEQDFYAVKEQFIAEVLERLRALAILEARILFREHSHKPHISLPQLSTELSQVIIAATDAIHGGLGRLREQQPDLIRALVEEYLPAVLLRAVGSGVHERIPAPYLDRVVASTLASRIVYREGLDYLRYLAPAAIADLALKYLRQERLVRDLVATVANSNLAEREQIARLLAEGGVAAAMRLPP